MEFGRTFTRSTLAAATLFALSLPIAANEATSAKSAATGAQGSTHPPVSTQYGAPSNPMAGSRTDSASPSIGANHGQAAMPSGSEASARSPSAKAQVTSPDRDLGMPGRNASDSGDRLASNSQVREVQQKLKSEGHDPGPIDGIKGPRTEAALKSFQQAKGIQASGELDPQTLSALKLSMASQSATTASVATPSRMNESQASPAPAESSNSPQASSSPAPSSDRPQASTSLSTSTDSPQSQASTSLGTSTDSGQPQASTSLGTSTDSGQPQASTSSANPQTSGSQSDSDRTGKTGNTSSSSGGAS